MARELNRTQWTDTEKNEHAVKGWRSRRDGLWTQRMEWDEKQRRFVLLAAPRQHEAEWPPVASLIRPSDYTHDLDRGTVTYREEFRITGFASVTQGSPFVVLASDPGRSLKDALFHTEGSLAVHRILGHSSQGLTLDGDYKGASGTVACRVFSPSWKNYSFHKVRIAPETVLFGCNFTQTIPNTSAIIITGPPDSVTFIESNLCNVRINPGWVLQGCNTCQSWIVAQDELDEAGKPTGNTIEDRQWIAAHSRDLPALVVPPLNAVTMRDF